MRVRHVLVRTEALGTAGAGLLDNTTVGVLYLGRGGMIIKANARAGEVLRQATVVRQGRGSARRLATDDGALGSLLADALLQCGRQAGRFDDGGALTAAGAAGGARQPAGDGHRLDFLVRIPSVWC